MASRQSAVEGLGVNPTFWQGKKVLVTGHTGFKGSWLSLWLQAMGAQVTGYALAPPTNPSLFEVAEVGSGMISIIGDIRDLDKLKAVFAKHQPEIVIHMAAQPLVRYSYQNPVETYSTATCIKDWLALHAEGKAPRSDNMPSLTWQESAEQLLSKILSEQTDK